MMKPRWRIMGCWQWSIDLEFVWYLVFWSKNSQTKTAFQLQAVNSELLAASKEDQTREKKLLKLKKEKEKSCKNTIEGKINEHQWQCLELGVLFWSYLS